MPSPLRSSRPGDQSAGARQGGITTKRHPCPSQVDCTNVMALRGDLVISSLTEFEESTASERWTSKRWYLCQHAALTRRLRTPPPIICGSHQRLPSCGCTRVASRKCMSPPADRLRGGLEDLGPAAGDGVCQRWDDRRRRPARDRQKGAPGPPRPWALVPLTADRVLWRTLTSTYAATMQARHSLVHRLAEVDQATGALTGRDESGQPLIPITADQQEAFCWLVQRAAMAVLAGQISRRERSDLAWQSISCWLIISSPLLAELSFSHRGCALHRPPSPVVSW